jgi:hypothetical protein
MWVRLPHSSEQNRKNPSAPPHFAEIGPEMTWPPVSSSSYICTGNKKGVNLRDKIKKELNNKLKKTGSIQQKKGKEQD